jgi:HAD superfamily hydrolase (TIGR01549 family)
VVKVALVDGIGLESPTLFGMRELEHGGVAGLGRPRAVLLDLDGTLTSPLLDFHAIRRDMGFPHGVPILEHLERLPAGERLVANEVLERHEREAARNATLAAGCRELLELLAGRGVPHAIITRNSLDSTRIVLDAFGLEVGVLVTREDPPYKPSPEPLRLALRRLEVRCELAEVWMVGDGVFDIEAANAAGTRAVWISHGKRRAFEARPCAEVRDLIGVVEMLTKVL